MNIAVISRSTTNHFGSGGMESHLKVLTEGLVKSGFQVTVITSSYVDANKTSIEIEQNDVKKIENGVHYHYIGGTTPGLNPLTLWEKLFVSLRLLNRGTPEGNKNFYKESAKTFAELDAVNQFDLVVSQSTSAKGLLSLNRLRTPLLAIIHGTISAEIQNRLKSNRSLKNWIRFVLIDYPRWKFEHLTSNKKFFQRVDNIVAVSKDLKNKFLADYPYYSEKTKVIYNGVDHELFKPGKVKYPQFTVLYIGRMEREKGVDLILRAIHAVRKKGINIQGKFIGTGVHMYEFEKLAHELGLLHDVTRFLGQIPNNELIEYYQKSHVFVFPSRREEGHPMTLSEAFCCGLPIIATRKGGLSELIKDGKTGYYVDDEDFESIAYLLEKISQNSSILNKMSAESRIQAESKFSKNAMIREYINLFNRIK